ncbi:MAG: hypothetical protein JXR96_05370 [Deltaproteobacteria bacterium]|nr:hypothetical protein [Deltaproteobacteria bacterium]
MFSTVRWWILICISACVSLPSCGGGLLFERRARPVDEEEKTSVEQSEAAARGETVPSDAGSKDQAVAKAAPRPIVVVFDIEAKGAELSATFLDGLSDYLSMRLAESGRYQVVPRSTLKERLVAQKSESYKACYDQSCQVELGRELAAEKTVASQILKLGSACKISLGLYDLTKAATERAATQEADCEEDKLVKAFELAVAELTGQQTESPGADAPHADLPGPQTSSPDAPSETGPAWGERVEEILRASRPDLEACLSRANLRILPPNGVHLILTVDSMGRIRKIRIRERRVRGRPVARCLKDAVRPVRLPEFQGPVREHVLHVSL